MLAQCPSGVAIPDVPISACPVSIGQIQKFILQRVFSSGSTKNKFIKVSANPNLLASWTPKLTASNGTKAVQTPYIESPDIVAGKARTFGGGNESLGGITKIIGKEPSTFTGKINEQPSSTIAALQAFNGETVGVYIVDQFGRIWCLADDATTPTEYYPIPIASLFVGDVSGGKIDSPSSNEISFQLMPDWSSKLVVITPTNFNALTDLVTANS
jgi:hypothetical protein